MQSTGPHHRFRTNCYFSDHWLLI